MLSCELNLVDMECVAVALGRGYDVILMYHSFSFHVIHAIASEKLICNSPLNMEEKPLVSSVQFTSLGSTKSLVGCL